MKFHFRHFLLLVLLVLVAGSFALKAFGGNWSAISSDGWGYYAYLPSIFHYGDVTSNKQMDELPEPWQDEAAGRLVFQPNGNYLNQYPIGVALLETPFYLTATVLNNVLFQGSFDQYSGPFQLMVLIAGICATLIGFYFLWKTLIKRFSDKVTFISLGLILFATNIIHYSTYDVSFSHVFSFALFAYLLYLLDDFTLDKKNLGYFLRLGLTFGLIITVRQTNVITALLFLPMFYKLYKNYGVGRLIKEYWKLLMTMFVATFLVFFIQMLYWKINMDSWLVFSYQGSYFDFLHPEFWNVLFSFRKGLFLWTPILLITIPGIYLMIRNKDKFRFVLPLVLITQLYIVSSWWAWSFGFAFGHRGFTEYLIIFAVPFAYAIKYMFSRRRVLVYAFLLLCGFLIVLNLNSMQQYWRGILNPDGMTAESYSQVFMKLCLEAIPGQGCPAVR